MTESTIFCLQNDRFITLDPRIRVSLCQTHQIYMNNPGLAFILMFRMPVLNILIVSPYIQVMLQGNIFLDIDHICCFKILVSDNMIPIAHNHIALFL